MITKFWEEYAQIIIKFVVWLCHYMLAIKMLNIIDHRLCCKLHRFQNLAMLMSFSFNFVKNYAERQATELAFTKVIVIGMSRNWAPCSFDLALTAIDSQVPKK